MSFSKAKIFRFNECKSDAPPPGAYDPIFNITNKSFSAKKNKKEFIDKQKYTNSTGTSVHSGSIEKLTLKTHLKSEKQMLMAEKRTKENIELWNIKNYYADCLEKADSHRRVIEKVLHEQDIKISQLFYVMEKLVDARITQERFNQSLQTELDRMEIELSICKEDIKNLKRSACDIAAEMAARKYRYKIIMDENQATISALCQRLIDS